MLPLSFSQVLALYTWFPLTALIFIMLLIARFYERFSGRQTFFRWYPLVVVAFGVAAVRYASSDQIIGDILGDAALTLGGSLLSVLSLRLCWVMLLRPQPAADPNHQPPAFFVVAVLGVSSFVGQVSILVLLLTLGFLSWRLGKVTHARPFFVMFFASALLVIGTILIRLWKLELAQNSALYDNTAWALSYHGLTALAVTMALSSAWRYWSWLFAERD